MTGRKKQVERCTIRSQSVMLPRTGLESGIVMRALYETIKGRFGITGRRRQPIRTAEDFRVFLEGEAAHVAQSAVYDYLRARAGRFAPQLFREAPFLQALEEIGRAHV